MSNGKEEQQMLMEFLERQTDEMTADMNVRLFLEMGADNSLFVEKITVEDVCFSQKAHGKKPAEKIKKFFVLLRKRAAELWNRFFKRSGKRESV